MASPETHNAAKSVAKAKRELRVLQVFDGLGMGGAETWLMSLLRYFDRQNAQSDMAVKFDVLLTGGERVHFDEEAEALGARLFYVPFTRRTIGTFARRFRNILREGRYDAIHDHQDYIAGLHFAIGAGLLPPNRIAHVHNPLYHRGKYADGPIRRLTKATGRWAVSRFATHVMGTSRQLVTEYGFDDIAGRVTLGAAHCGFDVEKYFGDQGDTHDQLCREFGWPETAKIILFVGRLDGSPTIYNGRSMTHKNPEFAVEVAENCFLRNDTVRMLMVGSEGSKRPEFESRLAGAGVADKVRILGTRPDVPRLMLGSDLLLFPSLAEGLGMVVVEAQAAGLPVLASDTTPRECVVNRDLVNFLSLDEDSHRWAHEVLRLINLPKPSAGDCNEAVRCSEFSIENSAHRLTDLYTPVGAVNER